KSPTGEQADNPALGLVLGTVLDGIPESVVLGLTLIDGGGVGVTMLAAIFLSNLPEAISATSGLTRGGWSSGRILGMWVVVTIASGPAAGLGDASLADASPDAIALVQAFAAGAILTMLADSMMPEAFASGGRFVVLWCAIGFSVAFALSALD